MRLTPCALAAAAALIVAPAARAGEDSPWPRTQALPANVRAVASVVRVLEAKVGRMERSASRYAKWRACIRGVPVSEYGDPDGRSGYLYDERDGAGPGYMPALAIDRASRPRREDYLFLSFSRRSRCRSRPTQPGGTAETASVRTPTLRRLERRVSILKRAARRLQAASERIDEWESCVSWVPVTEYGDPEGRFGYPFGSRHAIAPAFRPALAVDRSDWDDPDYMFLAMVGGDRPGRSCHDEPGEAVD